MFYDPAEYRKLLIELDKRGYQIVTHAIGAGAVHAVLDAYAELEKTNGPKTAGFVWSMYSISRRKTCRVLRSFRPLWACNRHFVAEVRRRSLQPVRERRKERGDTQLQQRLAV